MNRVKPMASFAPKVLQLHPTRRCNLRCLHCYSSSAPTENSALDVPLLLGAIADASAHGYHTASISGGEPLLYPGLSSLLREARRHGMRCTVTTNGLLLDERRIAILADGADLVAISLDGAPQRHNYLRNAPRAFEAMQERLPALRQSGIPFAFLFTLTHQNVDDLEWAAHFAAEQGARLLQVHPLEEVGRAENSLAGSAPTDVDATIAWLLAHRLRDRYQDRLKIHVDLVDRNTLRASQENRDHTVTRPSELPKNISEERAPSLLADYLSPLVVETDGTVVPLQYGFPRRYALGCLRDTSLENMAHTWLARSRSPLQAVYRRAQQALAEPSELPFANWYAAVIQAASFVTITPL
jgi:Fe-coproporphyrin III synthase